MAMQIFLVGGAVRDRRLFLPVTERDWVVTGARPEDLLRSGYQRVGKDFPVFLHPETHEEYALARQERKTGPGYTGFAFDTSPDVTLEQDLQRRDLTINAMAETEDGRLVDPFGGLKDLEGRWLRHVSPAFAEDPVRILRVARFAARFANLGFRIAPETLDLMQEMAKSGEVDALVAERVWKEMERALAEPDPAVFFEVLSACGALKVLFPQELAIDALKKASLQVTDPPIRFAILLHAMDFPQVKKLCERYRVPSAFRDLALLVVKYGGDYPKITGMDAEARVTLLEKLDAFRRPERFLNWLLACECCFDSEKRTNIWRETLAAAKQIDAAAEARNAQGADIAAAIHAARVKALRTSLHLH